MVKLLPPALNRLSWTSVLKVKPRGVPAHFLFSQMPSSLQLEQAGMRKRKDDLTCTGAPNMVLKATAQPVLIKQGKLQLNLSFAQDSCLIRSKEIDIGNE